jgi:hypothetical protein
MVTAGVVMMITGKVSQYQAGWRKGQRILVMCVSIKEGELA